MTANETMDIILRATSSDISNFNGIQSLDYEIWQEFEGTGITTSEYDALVFDAANWDDNFMNEVNALGNVAGVKPKKRCEDCN